MRCIDLHVQVYVKQSAELFCITCIRLAFMLKSNFAVVLVMNEKSEIKRREPSTPLLETVIFS